MYGFLISTDMGSHIRLSLIWIISRYEHIKDQGWHVFFCVKTDGLKSITAPGQDHSKQFTLSTDLCSKVHSGVNIPGGKIWWNQNHTQSVNSLICLDSKSQWNALQTLEWEYIINDMQQYPKERKSCSSFLGSMYQSGFIVIGGFPTHLRWQNFSS